MALPTAASTMYKDFVESRDSKSFLIHFAGDGAYPTGGTASFKAFVQAIVKAYNDSLGDAIIRGGDSVTPIFVVDQDCGQYVPFYDLANDKLKVLDGGSATRAEVSAATDLSGTTFKLVVVCK